MTRFCSRDSNNWSNSEALQLSPFPIKRQPISFSLVFSLQISSLSSFCSLMRLSYLFSSVFSLQSSSFSSHWSVSTGSPFPKVSGNSASFPNVSGNSDSCCSASRSLVAGSGRTVATGRFLACRSSCRGKCRFKCLQVHENLAQTITKMTLCTLTLRPVFSEASGSDYEFSRPQRRKVMFLRVCFTLMVEKSCKTTARLMKQPMNVTKPCTIASNSCTWAPTLNSIILTSSLVALSSVLQLMFLTMQNLTT